MRVPVEGYAVVTITKEADEQLSILKDAFGERSKSSIANRIIKERFVSIQAKKKKR